jgi:hypothetical protein
MAISFKSHHVHMHREAHTQQSVTLNAFSDFPGKVGGWVGQKSKEIERCLVKPHQDTVAIASVLIFVLVWVLKQSKINVVACL